MTRTEATATITTYAQPSESPLAAGSVISYEDCANPKRRGTVLGFRESRWGVSAVIAWDCPAQGEYCSHVEMSALRQAVSSDRHAGFKLVAAA